MGQCHPQGRQNSNLMQYSAMQWHKEISEFSPHLLCSKTVHVRINLRGTNFLRRSPNSPYILAYWTRFNSSINFNAVSPDHALIHILGYFVHALGSSSTAHCMLTCFTLRWHAIYLSESWLESRCIKIHDASCSYPRCNSIYCLRSTREAETNSLESRSPTAHPPVNKRTQLESWNILKPAPPTTVQAITSFWLR